MFPNKVKQLWAQNKPAINGWLSLANPLGAELMAAQGYDSLTIDLQHGMIDFSDALRILQALRAQAGVSFVRIPHLEPGIAMKVLDAGAHGIICPMVNTAADARRLVSYLRYPPNGLRSFGPTRAAFCAGADYVQQAQEGILALAMIETAQGVDNLEQIVATPGLDGVYIGPADLTLGVTNGRLAPGFDREEEEMITVIRSIVAAAHRAGIRAGLHCGSPDYAFRALGWGFDLVTISNDARLLTGAAAASVGRLRSLLEGEETACAPTYSSGY